MTWKVENETPLHVKNWLECVKAEQGAELADRAGPPGHHRGAPGEPVVPHRQEDRLGRRPGAGSDRSETQQWHRGHRAAAESRPERLGADLSSLRPSCLCGVHFGGCPCSSSRRPRSRRATPPRSSSTSRASSSPRGSAARTRARRTCRSGRSTLRRQEVVRPRGRRHRAGPAVLEPGAVQDRQGHALPVVQGRPESRRRWTGFVRTSADDGKTWSKPEMMPAGFYGPVRAKPIQLADGTILAGTSVESHRSWTPFVDRSTDDGKTWLRSNAFHVPDELRPDSADAVRDEGRPGRRPDAVAEPAEGLPGRVEGRRQDVHARPSRPSCRTRAPGSTW